MTRVRRTGEHQLAFYFGTAGSASPLAAPRARLETDLKVKLGRDLRVTVTDNRSTMVAMSQRRGRLQVRVHHMFLLAPPPVVSALARYIEGDEHWAGSAIDAFIRSNRDKIAPRPRPEPRAAAGVHHDLRALLRGLCERYLGQDVPVDIQWGAGGRRPRRRGRSSIKLGSYSEIDALILVHPCLDQSFVPEFFVEWVVFHELLHHVHGAVVANGRRMVHTPAFRADERKFERWAEAQDFERRNLDRLLRF